MFENWKERRNAIKKHILKMYDGTNNLNKMELNIFLEFIIGNYDLDDYLFEQIKEDIQPPREDHCKDIVSLENEEYQYNILDRRNIC